jgi:DNA-binding MarR family transcriptional regulator
MASKNLKAKLYTPQIWETSNSKSNWTRIYDDMILSPAYKKLTPQAKLIYFFLKREYKGSYNDSKDTVKLPYTQMAEFTGIRKNNIKNHLDELEALGFISISKAGGLYREINIYKFVPDWQYITDKEAKKIALEVKERHVAVRRVKRDSKSPE